MDWRERDRRLDDLLDGFADGALNRVALRDAIEQLMDEVSADAYENGAEAERECNINWE